MLRKVGHYNNLGTLPRLPKKGTIISYRFRALEIDQISGKVLYPHQVVVPPTSNYYDEETGNWLPIGLVDSIDNDGLIRVKKVRFHPQQEAGCLNITIGESQFADTLYQYLELASFVDHGDGRMRDENEGLILEKVDHDAEARAKRKARKLRIDALIAARQLEGAELTQAALVLGVFDPTYTEDQLREPVEALAERNPEHFMTSLGDPAAEAKAAIQHALMLGLLRKEGNLVKWAQTGGDLMQLTSDDGIQVQFAQYIETSEHGERILNELKRQIAKGAKQQVPGTAPASQTTEAVKQKATTKAKGTTKDPEPVSKDKEETQKGGLDDVLFGITGNE